MNRGRGVLRFTCGHRVTANDIKCWLKWIEPVFLREERMAACAPG